MNMTIMKKTIALLSITTLGILAMPVQAHQKSPDINRFDRMEQHLEKQHYRIRDGIDKGELTRKEARHLQKQQRFIMRLTHKFMYDGYLDRYEASKLRDVLERASRRIYHLKHNDRSRHTRLNTNRYYY